MRRKRDKGRAGGGGRGGGVSYSLVKGQLCSMFALARSTGGTPEVKSPDATFKSEVALAEVAGVKIRLEPWNILPYVREFLQQWFRVVKQRGN